MKRRNFGHLIEAVVYIFLLMFFTYTFIAVECLKDVDGVYGAYLQNQKTVLFPNAFIYMHLATIVYLVFIKYKSLEEVSVSVKF